MGDFEFSPLIAMVVAGFLGGAIGLQRQAAAKPAGFRTHALVATAAAAFTAMGAHLHDTRIPSYIVVGIGFLGSGAIVRDQNSTRGLTTAASIWMAAALGLAVGYANGFGLSVALVATAITLFTLNLSDTHITQMLHLPRKAIVRVTIASPEMTMAQIFRVLEESGVRYEESQVTEITNDGSTEIIQMSFLITIPSPLKLDRVLRDLSTLSGVVRVVTSEPPAYT